VHQGRPDCPKNSVPSSANGVPDLRWLKAPRGALAEKGVDFLGLTRFSRCLQLVKNALLARSENAGIQERARFWGIPMPRKEA
jgi:hypothetical protein